MSKLIPCEGYFICWPNGKSLQVEHCRMHCKGEQKSHCWFEFIDPYLRVFPGFRSVRDPDETVQSREEFLQFKATVSICMQMKSCIGKIEKLSWCFLDSNVLVRILLIQVLPMSSKRAIDNGKLERRFIYLKIMAILFFLTPFISHCLRYLVCIKSGNSSGSF